MRAVAVPPTAIPGAATVAIVPSTTRRVTFNDAESTSVNGRPSAGQTSGLPTSSVTVNAVGAATLGASLTGWIMIVLLADRDTSPSETVVVRVRASVLSAAGVYRIRPGVVK